MLLGSPLTMESTPKQGSSGGRNYLGIRLFQLHSHMRSVETEQRKPCPSALGIAGDGSPNSAPLNLNKGHPRSTRGKRPTASMDRKRVRKFRMPKPPQEVSHALLTSLNIFLNLHDWRVLKDSYASPKASSMHFMILGLLEKGEQPEDWSQS